MIRMKEFPPGEQLKVCTLSLICTDGILYSDWKFYTDCINPYFEDKKIFTVIVAQPMSCDKELLTILMLSVCK
jgi:hypothetical protein